jgi:hypothetical protein
MWRLIPVGRRDPQRSAFQFPRVRGVGPHDRAQWTAPPLGAINREPCLGTGILRAGLDLGINRWIGIDELPTSQRPVDHDRFADNVILWHKPPVA